MSAVSARESLRGRSSASSAGSGSPSACAACGTELPETAKFCPECGHAVGRRGRGGRGAGAGRAGRPDAGHVHAAPPRRADPHLAQRAGRRAQAGHRALLRPGRLHRAGRAARGRRACTSCSTASSRPPSPRSTATRARSTSSSATASWRSSARPLAHEDHARRAALAALGVARALRDRPVAVAPGPGRRSPCGWGLTPASWSWARSATTCAWTTRRSATPPTWPPASSRLPSRARSWSARRPGGSSRATSAASAWDPFSRAGPDRAGRRLPAPRRGLAPLAARGSRVARAQPLRRPRPRARDASATSSPPRGGPGPGRGDRRASPASASRGSCSSSGTASADRRVTYLEGRCLSYGAAIPYVPVLDLVRAACGIADADPPEAIAEKVRARAPRRSGLDVEAARTSCASSAGRRRAAPSTPSRPRSSRRGPSRRCGRCALRASRQRPLVLEIEDLHWIDRTSEEYLTFLAESLAEAPVLLVGTLPARLPAALERSVVRDPDLARGRWRRTRACSIVQSSWPAAAPGDPARPADPRQGRGQPVLPRGAGARGRRPADTAARAPGA